MADCDPERIIRMFMEHMWMKLNYISVLNVHLITDSQFGITHVLYFKDNQLEGSIVCFLG